MIAVFSSTSQPTPKSSDGCKYKIQLEYKQDTSGDFVLAWIANRYNDGGTDCIRKKLIGCFFSLTTKSNATSSIDINECT
jgi:hypothetical protein